MEQPSTIPFHIAISARQSNHNYLVRATYQSQDITSELVLAPELENLLLQLKGAGMPISKPKVLGQMLGEALFVPTLQDMFLRRMKHARQAGARLQLQLHFDTFDLIGLPWEWLSLPNPAAQQLGLRNDVTLVRINHHVGPHEPPAPLNLNEPLRILAIASEMEERQLDTLRRELKEAIYNRHIELQTLHRATPSSLAEALAEFSPHVLHCAAHVGFGRNSIPSLRLERSISAVHLASYCKESPHLRVVMLAGSQGDAQQVSVSIPALATMLLNDELPAVISLGTKFSANSAALCAAICYEQLAKATPIDQAVTAARMALAKQHPERNWGFVQLQLLPGAEQVFVRGNRRPNQSISRSHTLHRRPPPRPYHGPYPFHGLSSFLIVIGILVLVTFFMLLGNNPNRITFGTSHTPITILQPQPTIPITPMPPPESYATYIIGPNDTLNDIAAHMGSNSAAIAELNRLGFTKALHEGRVLMVPQYQPRGSSAGGQLVERGNQKRPTVALTFDIEIDGESVRSILATLQERNLKGTFFVTGKWVDAHPDVAREIVQQGHEIANHSYEHYDFTQIDLAEAANELEKTETTIQKITGTSAQPYFRFPYGASNSSVLALVAQHGYIAYHWTADDEGIPAWLERSAHDPSTANGSILLMHGRMNTAAALPAWLDRIMELGLHPTTLSETLR